MPGTVPPRLAERVRRSSGEISSVAVRSMAEVPWFAALSASDRAEVGLVVQRAVAHLADWLHDEDGGQARDAFTEAPRHLARSVSLKQAVQLVRLAVDAVEDHLASLATGTELALLQSAVLRYSRELAFAAAEAYAAYAEARGSLDARAEAALVAELVRGPLRSAALSRAQALGWGRPTWVAALACTDAGIDTARGSRPLQAVARAAAAELLVGPVAGGHVLVIGGNGGPPGSSAVLARLAAALPDGPVVVGPLVPDLAGAHVSVAEAVAGLACVPAWPQAPRVVPARDLLVERVLCGDPTARARLAADVHAPLVRAGAELLDTVAAFVDSGCSVEGTARLLYLHANTVRYRLRKVPALTGLDPFAPRAARTLQVALLLGRLSMPEPVVDT